MDDKEDFSRHGLSQAPNGERGSERWGTAIDIIDSDPNGNR
jgi:hypothetical protein